MLRNKITRTGEADSRKCFAGVLSVLSSQDLEPRGDRNMSLLRDASQAIISDARNTETLSDKNRRLRAAIITGCADEAQARVAFVDRLHSPRDVVTVRFFLARSAAPKTDNENYNGARRFTPLSDKPIAGSEYRRMFFDVGKAALLA